MRVFSFYLLIPVLLPIISGLLIVLFPIREKKTRNILTFGISILNLLSVLFLFSSSEGLHIEILRITDSFTLELGPDRLGMIFASLVSVLWPFSLLYGYEYMENEERQNTFFGFFMMSLGAVIGIAFSSDMFSMYIFYEMLTLFTYPLVTHAQTKEAHKAGRKYLTYMLGGAGFGLLGLIVVSNRVGSLSFTYGGLFGSQSPDNLILFIFVMIFMGFGVKAAIMPFGKWLIYAAVAPTPVTALLHAVAVVKAGAFACIRLIYYIFGASFLSGTWAQSVTIIICSFTILYGSCMAVKETHIKRRLAYSTISNLSYILLAACFMSDTGIVAALAHLVAHAVTKIGLFFCVGSIMHVTGKTYVSEIGGFGKKMKWIFGFFSLASLSLVGIPQFIGFVSKYRIIVSALELNNYLGYIGAGVILLSALLTAIYLFNIVIIAYFPTKADLGGRKLDNCHDPGWKMLLPIGFSAVMTIGLGFVWEPLLKLIGTIF